MRGTVETVNALLFHHCNTRSAFSRRRKEKQRSGWSCVTPCAVPSFMAERKDRDNVAIGARENSNELAQSGYALDQKWGRQPGKHAVFSKPSAVHLEIKGPGSFDMRRRRSKLERHVLLFD